MKLKTITFSLTEKMEKDVQQMALEERRTVSEFLQEAIRQYLALKNFDRVCKAARATVKKKRLTPKKLGLS